MTAGQIVGRTDTQKLLNVPPYPHSRSAPPTAPPSRRCRPGPAVERLRVVLASVLPSTGLWAHQPGATGREASGSESLDRIPISAMPQRYNFPPSDQGAELLGMAVCRELPFPIEQAISPPQIAVSPAEIPPKFHTETALNVPPHQLRCRILP